jgi:hypothetical protein
MRMNFPTATSFSRASIMAAEKPEKGIADKTCQKQSELAKLTVFLSSPTTALSLMFFCVRSLISG